MTPTEIIIHHSASHDGSGFDIRAIKLYHTKTLGYLDVGYHALVDRIEDDYFAVFGRRWWLNGAHTKGRNDRALGLAFVGNYNLAEPPIRALVVGADAVRVMMRTYGIMPSAIFRHSDFAATDCPGKLFPWEKFIKLCGGTP